MVCAQDMTARDCLALFDAVWAYAVALNYSIDALEEIGLTLSNYTLILEKENAPKEFRIRCIC